MSAAVLPCPFCGGAAYYSSDDCGHPCMRCGADGCEALGPSVDPVWDDAVDEPAAVAAWNRRVPSRGGA